MNPTAGLYSIVQFLSEPTRQEGVNIGVVLLLPGHRVVTKFAARNEQVKQRFRKTSYDEARLDMEKHGFERRLQSIEPTAEALAAFASMEAGSLRVLPAMPVRVTEVQAAISFLFSSLVDDPPRRTRNSRVGPDIRPFFQHFPVMVRRNVSVTVPISGEKFQADIAYRNGCDNFIKSSFFGSDRSTAMKIASDFGTKGLLLEKEQCKLIMVGDVSGARASEISQVLALHHVEFYSFNSVQKLVDRVRQDAHN